MKSKLTALFICLYTIGSAQENDVTLDPVTVTASLNLSPISRTGRNIISVPGDLINKIPAHSLDELLRFLPGIEVQQRGPAGSQSDIVLRGGTFQQVLVILDGIRINDPTTGHFNSYIPIAPSEIEKIEIMKGASSAVYGSEAVGGVINIITKSFVAKKDRNQKNLNIALSGGEYDLFNVDMGVYFQKKNTVLSAGFHTNNSDGQLQRGTRGYFHNNTASVSLKQFINENWSFSLRSSYDQRDFSAQNFYTTFVSDTAKEKVTSSWNQARISFQKNKHIVRLDAGYKTAKDHYLYNPLAIANNNRSNLLQFLLTENFRLNNETNINTGFQYINKQIRSNDRGDHSLDQVAAFIILDKKINDVTISPSIRLDHNNKRGTELISQVNLSYRYKKFQFRASAGKTTRDADFTELYNNYNKPFVSGGGIGNPYLIAEKSFSYEAGVDFFINKEWKISSGFFQRRQSDLIDWIPTPYSNMPRKENLSPTGSYALSKNIGKVITTGIETDLLFNKAIGRYQINSGIGFVWLNSKSDNATPSFYLSSHARYLANFYSLLQSQKFIFSISGIYKNRKPLTAYAINAKIDENSFVLNVKAGLYFLNQKLQVFGQVDNIFDNSTGDLLGTKIPGRWIQGGVLINLN